MVSDDVVLQLDNVYSGYGEILVLKGVSCTVPRSTITSIIGANGAGKSTLLKTIFGMLSVREGQIIFNGDEITNKGPLSVLRSGISYVPQGRVNFPEMTVQENLEMGAFLRKDDRVAEDINSMYERFPLLMEKRKELAGNLSGGQQQILEMAMPLLLNPVLLLVDEPSLGLSPMLAEEVFETIRQIRDDGTTILMVEQNAQKALEFSDYAFVLELGRNWMEGTGKEILEDPRVRLHYLGL